MNEDDLTKGSSAHEEPVRGPHWESSWRPRGFVIGLGIALVAGVWLFRGPLRYRIFAHEVLINDAPTAAALDEFIQNAPNPGDALLALWNTGKIVHRQVAINELSQVVPYDRPLPVVLRPMLLSAALDPDMDVREAALSYLELRHDPALTPLAAAQLHDVDPLVRLLGLDHLDHTPAKIGVPLVMPLLHDADPRVVASALKLLEGWSGEQFGVKLADAVPVEDEKTGVTVFSQASYAKTRAGAERAKAWWAAHQADFQPVREQIPAGALAGHRLLPAQDFILPGLDGGRVRLAAFRGKVVLINFWTTWCTACVGEMPVLIALQKQNRNDFAILGVSLDFVPDEEGNQQPDPDVIRQKIVRTIKARGINYPILLDERGEVGGRFNGGELPTTVILDAQGNVRRRFVGPRSLAVFEAMIAEAAKPLREPPH